MSSNFFSKKFWIALVTVLCIGLVLCYYLFVVVTRKEKNLIAEGYRVLKQIDKNIQNKTEEIKKTADFLFESCRLMTEDDLTLKRLKSQWQEARKTRRSESERYQEFILALGEKNQKNIPSIFEIDRNWDSYWNSNPDAYYYFEFNSDPTFQISFQVRYDSIITGTFHKLEILDEVSTAKDVKQSKDSAFSKIIYQTFPNKIKIRSSDSLLRYSNGIYSGGITETVVSDNKYKVFVHRIELNGQQGWTLMGFVKTSTFRGKAQAINPTILFSLLLLSILTLLAFPILKLAIMSSVERLRIGNVASIGVSLTFGF